MSNTTKSAELNLNAIRIKCAELMGWQIHPKDRFVVIPPNSPHSVQPLSTIPPYTDSADAALELVNWMTDKARKSVELTRSPDNRWVICVRNAVLNGPCPFDRRTQHLAADTLPIAVCLAILHVNNTNPEELK